MTQTIACLGTHCAYKKCRKPLREDEGVLILHKGKVVPLHSRCARIVKQRRKRREARRGRGEKRRAKPPTRRSRRVGTVP